MPDKTPDPSPSCPRCHYWERTAVARAERNVRPAWPLGIDQDKAVKILTTAFPPKQRQRA